MFSRRDVLSQVQFGKILAYSVCFDDARMMCNQNFHSGQLFFPSLLSALAVGFRFSFCVCVCATLIIYR